MLERHVVTTNSNPKTLASFINCLSLLESNTYVLYKELADKVETPLVRSFLLQIAIDSHKHSLTLKGVAESIAKPSDNLKDCEKKIGESWRIVETLLKDIKGEKTIPSGDFPKLAEKLSVLESILGEEYYMFIQLKTLKVMMKEINQIYNIDLGSVKKIFLNIIRDEETHRELIEKIKNLVTPETKLDTAPVVKYQNPDAWSRPLTTLS
jgi:rubrerythrin